MQESKTQGRMH